MAVALSFGLFAVSPVLAVKPSHAAAKSAECSKEADLKGLHGTRRTRFLSECIKSTA
jgi:hypothetical protein